MKTTFRSFARILLFSTATLLYVPALLAATAESNAGAQLGSSAVWNASAEKIDVLRTACDASMASPAQVACVASHMKSSGASADAVLFMRALFESKREIGIMIAFKNFKSVGLAGVLYPFRAEAKDGLLFVNSDPNFLDPNDLSYIDRSVLEHDTNFQQWNKTAMTLKPWPNEVAAGGRQVEMMRNFWGDKPGELRFLFSYRLGTGNPGAGTSMGFANYWWSFDGNGKFEGVKLLGVARGVPPKRRGGDTEPDATPGPAARPNAVPSAPQHP